MGETVSCLSAPIKTEIKEMTSVEVAEREKNKKKGRRDPGAFIWYLKKTRLRGSRSMIKKLKNELFSSKRTGCFAWTRSGRLKHQGGHFCLIFPLTVSLIAGNIR